MPNRKSIQIVRNGGPEAFELRELPPDPLTPDGVRIAVQAAGVNFADIMMRMGMYPEAPPKPFTPGYEVAGTVLEVGAQVSHFKVGDRVVAGCKFGGYTTEIVLPAFQMRRIPAGMSEIEAASIPVNFMTAWVALEDMGRVRKGDRVLIQSAAGGVGVAATQIAHARGARVVGTMSSENKFNTVKSLGLESWISNESWDSKNETQHGLFDIILDPTGGASLKRSVRRLALGGRVINFGMSSWVGEKRTLFGLLRGFLQTPLFTPFGLMMGSKGVFGLNMLSLFDPGAHDPTDTLMGRAFSGIMDAFEKGQFKTVIGKTFPLEQAGEAHRYLQGRGNVGKVVLTTPSSK